MLCWGVPAIQTLVPLLFHKFEDRIVWYVATLVFTIKIIRNALIFRCWISESDSGLWELTFFYAIMGVLGVTTGYFWVHVVVRIRRVSSFTYMMQC